MASEIILKDVRIAFPDIWTPKAFQGDGKPRFAAKFPIEPESANDKMIGAAITAEAVAKWKDQAKTVLTDLFARDKMCYVKRNILTKEGKPVNGFEGMFALSASADPAKGQKPLVVDRKLQATKQEDGVIYGGCRVDVKVSVWAQDNQFGRRINCQLLVVQHRADDDAFGAGAPPTVKGMEALEDVGEEAGGDLADLMG